MTSRALSTPDGSRIHVEVDGDGSPVVVLHGFTGSIGAMRPLIERLVGFHTVIAVDLVGHGRSSAPPGVERYRAERLHADLDVVLAEASTGTPALVGYSLGARLALSYACARPKRVTRIAVIGAGLGPEDEAARRTRTESDEALARLVEQEGVTAFVDHWMGQPLIAEQAERDDPARSAARSHRLQQHPNGISGMLRGFGKGVMPPLTSRLGNVAVPVLAIVGADDTQFIVEADRIVRLVPDARMAVVDGAGHAPHLARPAATADLLLGFLAGDAA